jgi:hypothetical protein
LSSLVVTRFLLRPGADPAAFGSRAAEFCTRQRSLSGLVDSSYYWAGRNSVVVVTEVPLPVVKARGVTFAAGEAARAFRDIAYQTDFEVWQRDIAAA